MLLRVREPGGQEGEGQEEGHREGVPEPQAPSPGPGPLPHAQWQNAGARLLLLLLLLLMLLLLLLLLLAMLVAAVLREGNQSFRPSPEPAPVRAWLSGCDPRARCRSEYCGHVGRTAELPVRLLDLRLPYMSLCRSSPLQLSPIPALARVLPGRCFGVTRWLDTAAGSWPRPGAEVYAAALRALGNELHQPLRTSNVLLPRLPLLYRKQASTRRCRKRDSCNSIQFSIFLRHPNSTRSSVALLTRIKLRYVAHSFVEATTKFEQ